MELYMAINLHLPGKSETLRPTITVIGVGGAGGNAVNNMITANLEGVNFVVANTDAQALESSLTERRIQLGSNLTRGLGAGAKPEIGRAAAEEALDEIAGYVDGSNMVFITAGMGGGTGTGAAPVIARYAKDRGILTVGVVTKPFQFEGSHRMQQAEKGVHELQQFVDTLIVIPNQNLFRVANEKTTFADAFRMADEVLHSGVRGVTDLMIMPGLINLDFADIRTVMGEMGKAMMGTGEAEGPKRAVEAAEAAISNPLLDDVSMKGARGVLINITGSYDMTLFEADEAASRIREEVDPNANIIFGATFNQALEGKMRVSVVATGIDGIALEEPKPFKVPEPTRIYGGKIGFVAPSRPAPEPLRFPPQASAPTRPVEAPQSPAAAPEPVSSGLRRAAGPVLEQKPAPVEASRGSGSVNSLIALVNNVTTCIGAVKLPEEETRQVPQPVAMPVAATAGGRTPSFVSPAPMQPVQRNFFANTDDNASYARRPAAAPQGTRNFDNSREKEPASGSAANFISRMANVGRAIASAKPEAPATRTPHVVEKVKVEVTDRTAKAAAADEYLEIPAFLRRQAN